ncbi:Glyoxylase, beta-lactamase superfamily II [Catalinimonas alkaloidigena]|uniref:Glyoxylase, beta-lactamase superfamily II n=1 Tax=Catalinimonas alkaloidigena TaxID=1075417 RepID=A0A1G9NY14_9BACT|nr:MBL fold metallo-hydrolase [Catalinimonas alkaloidigena]SDL91468.1 Glyoxylase, beta-lactamase superfamily II [Catalinimonas alkaloidigena]
MHVHTFYNPTLAHASYAVCSGREIALVDPGRDPEPYLAYARQHFGRIVAVLETHPHADFASSHLEFHEKHGAVIYVNPRARVTYPHRAVDEGDWIRVGNVGLQTRYTPGHSLDHNAYLLRDELGEPHAIFTGDSLLMGDVGRPDLHEGDLPISISRRVLAELMYKTLQRVYEPLQEDILIYPTHGSGSLCGRQIRSERYSTLGWEKRNNWAFRTSGRKEFIQNLLENPPFRPPYFSFDIIQNRAGFPAYAESLQQVRWMGPHTRRDARVTVIDTRRSEAFRAGHVAGAINLRCAPDDKFETWLGTLVRPYEPFYLVVEDTAAAGSVLRRIASIGYEKQLLGVQCNPDDGLEREQVLNLTNFRMHPDEYTILDVRLPAEAKAKRYFAHAHAIPLPELKRRMSEVPTELPIVVHCAGGYQSAAGASMLSERFRGLVPVYDLGEAVHEFAPLAQSSVV